MTRDHFIFKVTSEIRFTEEEALLLEACAKGHYDRTCRAAGEKGFITGLVNQFWAPEGEEKPETCTLGLTTRELDLLCKITEQLACERKPSITSLHNQFVEFLYEANDAYKEKNP